jgi:hypothetical protein
VLTGVARGQLAPRSVTDHLQPAYRSAMEALVRSRVVCCLEERETAADPSPTPRCGAVRSTVSRVLTAW